MDLSKSMHISAAGMRVQGARMRVVAENLANADSAALTPGGEPYRRRTVAFGNALDRELGVELVRVERYGVDPAAPQLRHDPGHPAADADGYVRMPNVEPLIELMDMREAQRSFEANLNALALARAQIQRTLGLLR